MSAPATAAGLTPYIGANGLSMPPVTISWQHGCFLQQPAPGLREYSAALAAAANLPVLRALVESAQRQRHDPSHILGAVVEDRRPRLTYQADIDANRAGPVSEKVNSGAPRFQISPLASASCPLSGVLVPAVASPCSPCMRDCC
eukprot:SM000008S22183  [mRNA]  locus=s8:278451:279129:+ [translate_table: standard]